MFKHTALTLTTRNLLAIGLCFISLISTSTADDLDIYTSSSDASGSGNNTVNHNLLFILDTSGSMKWGVAGLATSGDYDPNVSYGDPNDDQVYVYNANTTTYSGIRIQSDQNVCQSMKDIFDSSGSSPIYIDRGVQWKKQSESIPQEPECTPIEGASGTEIPEQEVTNLKKGTLTKIFSAAGVASSDFSINIKVDRKARVFVQVKSSGFFGSSHIHCDDNYDKKEEITCEGSIPFFWPNTEISIWVENQTTKKKKGKFKKAKATFSGTINTPSNGFPGGPGGGETCITPPPVIVNSSEWTGDLFNSDSNINILDCSYDSGDHGHNSGSASKYVTQCSPGEACNNSSTGNYSANENDEFLWSTVPLRSFIPANYHYYLQSNHTTSEDSPNYQGIKDAEAYCGYNTSSRIGHIVKDIENGLFYECFRRIDIMRDAMTNLASSLRQSPLNIGLMRFNTNNQGGTVVDAIDDIGEDSNYTDFINKLNALEASGRTPLAESLHEAYLYFKGAPKQMGYSSTTDNAAGGDPSYSSPITNECQSNNIIYLSDGEPTDDSDQDENITSLYGGANCGSSGNQSCLDEMALVLATTDVDGDASNGDNRIKTYTIGLSENIEVLETAAEKGDGQYFIANNAQQLQASFQEILVEILTDASTFVAPAVSVNAFNELQHRNEIYYALFEPRGHNPKWLGNVKKYTISTEGVILDQNNEPAISDSTGFFKEQAHSFWSNIPDGRAVASGGVLDELSAARKVYTESSDDDSIVKISDSSATDYSNITSLTGRKEQLLEWLLGSEQFLADPLHSRPSVVTYGGDADAPEDVLFFATNLGTLHAVDPSDNKGTELWSYIPKQHMDNLALYYDNMTRPYDHVYGLDGDMTIITKENTGSTSKTFSLASVQLYIGERRGGSRYHGFDVSNARRNATPSKILNAAESKPFTKLWTIQGGIGGANGDAYQPDDASSGFVDLGQSWSRMVPSTLTHSVDNETEVLIFTGGYDPAHDNKASYLHPSASTTEYGNAIYIVDASNGNLLYSIGNNNDARSDTHQLGLDMRYSIPSTPTVLDIDNDGDVDIIFVIDIMGHVWRIDFDESKTLGSSEFSSGGMIADLSDGSVLRRFYNSVDVSKSNPRSGSNHYNIIVGSGYRAHPDFNENLTNRLYIIFDKYLKKSRLRELSDDESEGDQYKYVRDNNDNFQTITFNDIRLSLFDDNDASTSDDVKSIHNSPYGIYIDFSDGEKILQNTLTFNGIVLVSTFDATTQSSNTSSCGGGGSLGVGRVYLLDLNTSLPVFETVLDVPGIPTFPTIIVTGGGPPTICLGTECFADSDYDEDDSDEDDSDEGGCSGIASCMFNGFQTGTAYKTFWRED